MKSVKVPLELVDLDNDGFHLLVEVVVFGQAFNLVLDTGASKTVFDKDTVEQFCQPGDVLESDHISTGLGASDIQSYTLVLKSVSLGRLKLNEFETAVLDLSVIKSAYQKLNLPPVIGVLGGDILVKQKALIDYQKLTLKLNLADK